MNEKVNRELTYISILFIFTSIILFVNTLGNMVDELQNESLVMGILVGFGVVVFYISMVYYIIHDLFFPIREKAKGQIAYYTLCKKRLSV